MNQEAFQKRWKMVGLRYKSHPWHGIDIGELAPESVTAFIEIIPSDTVKYEIDKRTGYLKVDRPQKFSNIVPARTSETGHARNISNFQSLINPCTGFFNRHS